MSQADTYRSAQPSFKHLFQREQSVSKLRSEVAGTGRAILFRETNFREHPRSHGHILSPGDVNTTTGNKKKKRRETRNRILTSRLITLTGRMINRRRKNFGRSCRGHEGAYVCLRKTYTHVSHHHQLDFERGD